MHPTTESVRLLDLKLGSVEEMSPALAGSAWATEFQQLERGAGHVRLTALATDGWMLMHTGIERATHQVAHIDGDMIAFGLPAQPQAPVRFSGREIDSSLLTRFDTRAGLDAVSASGFGAYTLAYRRDRLGHRLHNLGLDTSLATSELPQVHQAIPASTLSRLRQIMADLVAVGRPGNSPAETRQVFALESDLALELFSAVYRSDDFAHLRPSNRSRIVKLAVDCIRAHATQVLTVEDLCRESAASISTLERAFREHFGLSPKQYLVASRLSGARRALLNPANTDTIGNVAADWGFWHLGQFAADYKRLYGELPSATRRAAA